MKKRYCKIFRKRIIGKDYFRGFGFIHYRVRHERVYGIEFTD